MAKFPEISDENRAFLSKLNGGALGSRYLYLLHDDAGTLIEILNPENPSYLLPIRELQKSGTLEKFYRLPPAGAPGVVRALRQATPFQWNPNLFELVTSLPETTLITQALEKDFHFARINLNDFLPNGVSHGSGTYLFAEREKDLLLGFTPDLHELFKPPAPAPETLLGQSLPSLFSPSPREFQAQALASPTRDAAGPFTVVFDKTLCPGSLGPLAETPVGGFFETQSEGLLWENQHLTHSFITLLKELQTETQDFTVTLTFQNQSGLGPYFVLGNRYVDEDRLPDNTGYLVGRVPFPEKKIALKKNGFLVCTADDPGLTEKITTLRFCKSGPSLRVFQDEALLTGFYDGDFIHRPAAFITLGLRKGDRCLLKRLSLAVKSNDTREKPRRHVARWMQGGEKYFTIDRFYNRTLNSPEFAHVAGFYLNNITDLQERIINLDRQYRHQMKTEEKLKNLLKQYQKEEDFVGAGGAMTVIRETAKTVAVTNATILLEGPTGSGKEVLARFIHGESGRRKGPFVKVDCSTLPASLMESQLFGHEKGAFTGALSRHAGLFEIADGGTLFLDEAENLTLDAQAKLLQFLNDFTLTRVGGTTSISLNVRCIVASNTRLEESVLKGVFREDLFYRINVVNLRLPPLKERIEDLPALCRRFLAEFNTEHQRKIAGFTPQALQKLSEYGWPGNIRELRNVVHRAVIFCQGETISAETIQFPEGRGPRDPGKKPRKRSPFYIALTRKAYVTALLKKHHGNVTKVSAVMGITRATLYKFIRREKIRSKKFRRGFGPA